MIRISQLKLPVKHSKEELENKIRKALHLNSQSKLSYTIQKRSMDARKKPVLYWVYTVDVDCPNEERVLKASHNPSIALVKREQYQYPVIGSLPLKHRPVIIGFGPAGLFCAYLLTEMGYAPLVLERGKQVEDRTKDVEEFWKTGVLDPNSNVQYGEGGAGTFSDGKLNTAVKDKFLRNQFVLETFVRFGADPVILYDYKPHIGTDVLVSVIRNMREYLIEKGCEIRFETQVMDLIREGSVLKAVATNRGDIPCDIAVLAVGHSARDSFRRFSELGLPMEAKQFAVGFRVEHPQSMINEAMFGNPKVEDLFAAPYKVTANFPNGRGVYSFCMCPGGYVVNASSAEGQTVVNGMSYSGRDSGNANSAIIVSVGPKDYPSDHALAGMEYQIELEKKAYALGQGKIPQQLYGDYVDGTMSSSYGDFASCIKGAGTFADLRGLFRPDMETSFRQGMDHFNQIIPGFTRRDAILSGVEARTSSPVRILRDENFESEYKGIYPCGEGAGYAGGIVSAAMDGIKVAEAIIQKYQYKG